MIYLLIVYSIIKLYLILDIYQQSHYQIKSYSKYFLSNIIFNDFFPFITLIVGIIPSNEIVGIICGCYIVIYSILYFILKVKLKFSKRIIRNIILSIFYIIFLSYIPYANSFFLLFIEFSIIPLFLLDRFISYLLNMKYIIRAKRKINNSKGNKILITGSYGKTSTKLLFNQILRLYSSSITTPKSYNTPLGISMFVNNSRIEVYDNIILEMGASHTGDIDELLKITHGDVAVVTEVGYMHMDGFKNIDNVLKEKMKITRNAKVVILNYENELIRNCELDNKIILSYGFNYGDYRALNIIDNEFDFYYKDQFIEHFNTSLIGKHQILNILAPLAYIHYLGYDVKKIKNACRLFKLEDNRLELKRIGNRIILNDSFNSNLNGFKNALAELNKYNDKKILITPGIVELGVYKTKINRELAECIVACCDIVIVVGLKEVEGLYYELKKYNVELHRAYSFKEAYSLYMNIAKEYESSALLIENDLPDLYKRRLIV